MNKWIFVGLLTTILGACGLGQPENDSSHPSQKAPSVVTTIAIEKNNNEQDVLIWQGQGTAKGYVLYISTDIDFSLESFQIYRLTDSSFPISNLTPGEKYYTKVITQWNGNESPESDIFTFYVPPASPVSLGITIDNVTSEIKVQWDVVEGATSYNVYWSLSDDVSTEKYQDLISDISQNSLVLSLVDLDVDQDENVYFIVTSLIGEIESLVSQNSNINYKITEQDLIIPGPEIMSIFPDDSRANVGINLEKINVTFKNDIATASVNSGTFQVFRPDNSQVSGVVTYNSNDKTASFTPENLWVSNTTYTVKLTTGIKLDSSGITLSKNFVSSFTTSFPSISVADISVDESSANVNLVFSLNVPSGSPVNFLYSTADGTSKNGKDYEAQSKIITLDPGETEFNINLLINEDIIYEGNEQFYVNFSNPSGVTFSKARIIITINDNEALPTLSIADVSVNEAVSSVKLTAFLSHPSSLPIQVDYVTADITAKAGINQDYLSNNGRLIFAEGETTQSFNISINKDLLSENPETFNVNFSNVQGATLAKLQTIVTITDNNGLPTLSMENITVDEAIGVAKMIVTLSTASGQTINVNYATVDDSAIAGNDYTAIIGTLVFLAGETSQTINVDINNDVLFENLENLNVTLSNAVNGNNTLAANISVAQVNINIVDNDVAPSVSIEDQVVSESVVNAELIVTLSSVSGKDIIVDYETTSDTATAAVDYVGQINSITINAGKLSNTINIEIKNDDIYEINEQFKINFSNGTVNSGTTLVTINDDDVKPTLSIDNISISEAVGLATVTFRLSEVSGAITTLSYRTADDTAEAVNDYVAISNGVMQIDAGETSKNILVTILNDTIPESNEQFFLEIVTIENATNNSGKGVVLIENDDSLAAPVLTLKNINGVVSLQWPNVTFATDYNVYYSRESGVKPGNYGAMKDGNSLVSQNSGLKFSQFHQLTNPSGLKLAVNYYFVATALVGNYESPPSNEKTTLTKIIPLKPRNDTGIVFGADYLGGNNTDCTGVIIEQQDCKFGRDFTQNNDVNGHAGFNYTKRDNSGSSLSSSATNWACVRDNVTGLIWEKKTNSGLRDTAHTYTWFNSIGNNNGAEGTTNGGVCDDSINCDTQKFVSQVNSVGLCGAFNWRLPTVSELGSLLNLNTTSPSIDKVYFPNSASSAYWSSSPNANSASNAWFVSFANGYVSYNGRSIRYRVRLVRDGL